MLLSFFAMQIDRLLLGKLGDFTQLGIYHFAFSLTLLASMVVEKLSNTVQFPVLASVANVNPELLPERATSVTANVTGHRIGIANAPVYLGPV